MMEPTEWTAIFSADSQTDYLSVRSLMDAHGIPYLESNLNTGRTNRGR